MPVETAIRLQHLPLPTAGVSGLAIQGDELMMVTDYAASPIAMNTRSYRGGRYRTKLRQLSTKPSDWLVLALVVAWTVVAWLA